MDRDLYRQNEMMNEILVPIESRAMIRKLN